MQQSLLTFSTVTFSTLPVLGCLRDRRGTILSVTQRLLDAERKRAADVVGRRLIDVWPHGAAWLKLDARALRTRQPLIKLEHSNGRWFQSTRIPQSRSRILWVAEDRTAEIQLKALHAVLRELGSGKPPSADALRSAPWLRDGAMPENLAHAFGWESSRAIAATVVLMR
jgi:hypothetical protein